MNIASILKTVFRILLLFVASGVVSWVGFRHGSSAGFGLGLIALVAFAISAYALMQLFWIGVQNLVVLIKVRNHH